ncbi:S41 family peptidase [Petralouisia muris]|uniref:S41 family peptidase n=1 Tax=Petralouisia muris TaxID=3032872 RepID=A0AC61RVI3_9FIRM|nr:S41 family peptidase [Petralouisia muris]TGY96004.1 S41 family peptidase [Petralouisia muris]
MDYQEYLEPPRKNKSNFGKGVAVGTLATLLVVTLTAGGIWLGVSAGSQRKVLSQNEESSREAILEKSVEEKSGEIADLIDQYYYEDVDEEALVEGMYAGMVEGLGDPYSAYYTAEEYRALTESTSGIYYGIGAVLTQNVNTKVVTILHVYPGTPAEEAGVKDGDVIVKVGDIEGDSMELSELVTHIKGEEGTTVHLELLRSGELEHIQLDVERRQIEVPTVQSEMLEGQVGFIQISEFSESTPEQFSEAWKELENQGMESVIVDLRDNPGGVLQSVCAMLDAILPKGLLVYTEDKYGSRSEYKSDAECTKLPMAVLINGNSASASEIFAGAIKDYEYGTLIGTTSFGKGIVQTIIPMEDGSAVKVTMAKYFTPKGNYIHGAGIEPDIELEYSYQEETEGEVYNPLHDNQVLKALEVLQKGENSE